MIKLREQGFLILEMAIILCIIGLISTTYIKSLVVKKDAYVNNITKENIQTVTYAIVDFLARNYRLPSPSSSLESGIEDANGCGYIPYKILGISLKDVKSGNGSPLFYVVEKKLTTKDINRFQTNIGIPIVTDNCFCKFYKPTIQIIESDNSEIDKNSKIAFSITDKQPIEVNGIYKIYDTYNTKWFTRGLLLSKYLKQPPCISESVIPSTENNPKPSSVFDDFL